ncbi:hypothetical protein P7B02_03190 [Caulobacter segnis]|uniref:hypothetical protein n=1 Tax=Caulobacter segnis TaxID=88688 RepID=UPI0024101897|nr:hypothetical protein [Caulobacter segnis]MDG2520535.1 hypothetical protein [Caulobacter segnis]
MVEYEYRGYAISLQHGCLALLASATCLRTGAPLPRLVTATFAEGVEVLMRRIKIAVNEELRSNPTGERQAPPKAA